MKRRAFWLRMVPVIAMVAATVFLSIGIYSRMIQTEEEVCWQRLEIATNSTSQKIQTRIQDNLNFLTTVSDAYVLTQNIADLDAVGDYLTQVVQNTIFQRIDVILPDDTLITQAGENSLRGGKSSFRELAARGTHITQRLTSSFTGEEVICCVTPIQEDEQILGLLVGTIDCKTLSEIFEVFTYGQACQLFLVDRADGNYLMDNWHQSLGNIYEMGSRQSIDGRGTVDFVSLVVNGARERTAYISQTNGERSYLYCAPVEGFNWEVFVVVQEDVVFANVQDLRRVLIQVGVAEGLLVLGFALWNLFMNLIAVRSEEKLKQLEYETAKNEARATFISNMSHDIKTPLNGIVGMLQIIRNHRSEALVVDECLDKIEISAQYLSTLTSDMLDISEIENDKLILPEEPVDLRTLAEELSTMVERQAEDAGVRYQMDCSGIQEPYILGSSVHIKRILVNLIGNAIKYSKNAGKQIWVTMEDAEGTAGDGKRMYRFVVRDNGIGMSKEFQKTMYQAFEQEANSARSEYQGYGLGLTIVSHLIRKMDGTIALESVKGQGSTFTVSIPFLPDPQGQNRRTEKGRRIDLTGLHLLLVEDNEFNLEIADVLLTDAGARVDTAVNGRIAADLFAVSRPHLYNAIIMDVMMPEMDGCEATRVIRALDRPDAKTIPIIAMTANTFSEDIARCLEAGMNAHIPKPVDIHHLIAAITELCSGPEQ